MHSALRRTLLPALLLALPVTGAAQRMGPAHFPGVTNFHGAHIEHRAFRGGYYPGFFDSFYADDRYRAGYTVPSLPQVVVVQPPAPAAPPEPPPSPSQPLMIELQGDRYVQISGDQPSRAQMIDSGAPAKLVTRADASPSPTPAVAVLIFRDGHREEVTGYTIADSCLYVTSNYTRTGYWIQKIELSALNLPDTIAANSSHDHKFQLPSSPNEVIVGP